MIVDRNVRTIERTGIGEEVQFGIKTEDTPYIFSILRNDLYSDKVMAVVREYSTNAIDAHIEAGIERPIKITVPSPFNRTYIVRDYGKGLSPEDVIDIFTKYGASTKRESNAFNGMLGLGSKSAFAYTTEFQVISRYRGTQYTWLAHIDESDIGVITLIDQKPTSESGLSIHINVRVQDIKLFKDRLFDFFKEVDHLPEFSDNEITQNIAEYKSKRNTILSGSDWRVDSFINYQTYIHMGNVAYPFNTTEIVNEMCDSGQFDSRFMQKSWGIHYTTPLSYGSWHIFAPIGSISFTPNREQLQMNEKTKKYLFGKINSILQEIDQTTMEKISSACSLWEKKCVANELKNTLNFNLPGIGKLSLPFTKLETIDYEISSVKQQTYDLRFTEREDLVCKMSALYFLDCPAIPRVHMRGRIRQYCADNKIEIRPNSWKGGCVDIFLISFSSKEKKDNFKLQPDFLGSNFIDLEEISYTAPKKIGDSRKGEVGQAYRYFSGERLNFDKWKAMNEIPEKCVWVEIANFMPKEYEKDNNLIEKIHKVLYTDMKQHFKLVGIKTADKKNVGSEWIELKDYIKTSLDNFKKNNRENFEIYCMFRDLNLFWTHFINPYYEYHKERDAPNYLLEHFKHLNSDYKIYRNICKRYSEIEWLATKFDIPFLETIRCKEVDEMIEKFPILSAFDSCSVNFEKLHNKIKELL